MPSNHSRNFHVTKEEIDGFNAKTSSSIRVATFRIRVSSGFHRTILNMQPWVTTWNTKWAEEQPGRPNPGFRCVVLPGISRIASVGNTHGGDGVNNIGGMGAHFNIKCSTCEYEGPIHGFWCKNQTHGEGAITHQWERVGDIITAPKNRLVTYYPTLINEITNVTRISSYNNKTLNPSSPTDGTTVNTNRDVTFLLEFSVTGRKGPDPLMLLPGEPDNLFWYSIRTQGHFIFTVLGGSRDLFTDSGDVINEIGHSGGVHNAGQ